MLVARDLDAVAASLQRELGLREPFADPGVAHFGLRNAVFVLTDTFLEVVSPTRPDTAAGRLLERRRGDCGYMLMFQVADLEAARERVRELGVREVFEVSVDGMKEVHLHPVDMRAAIVSLSQPEPPESWRWGGPDWHRRAAPLRISGATVAVRQPVGVATRWQTALDTELQNVGVQVSADDLERGLTEILISADRDASLDIGGVRFVLSNEKEESEE